MNLGGVLASISRARARFPSSVLGFGFVSMKRGLVRAAISRASVTRSCMAPLGAQSSSAFRAAACLIKPRTRGVHYAYPTFVAPGAPPMVKAQVLSSTIPTQLISQTSWPM
jgi:hypothetical protein